MDPKHSLIKGQQYIMSVAYNQMCTSGYFLSQKQTLWAQIRLLLREQSDLGP